MIKSKYLNRFTVLDIVNLQKKGIYKISTKDYCYIGSTIQSFNKRLQEHHHFLCKQNHHVKKLQELYNNNEDIFFDILEIIDNNDIKYLHEREKYYIDLFKANLNTTDPVLQRLPQKVYDKLHKKIYKFDTEGNLLKEYISITDAVNDNKTIDRRSIINTANNKRKTAGGYIWSFTKNVIVPSKRLIKKYDLNMNFLKSYNSVEDIMKDLKINSHTAIKNCFIGKQKQAYGFKWTLEIIPEKHISYI